MGTVPFFLVILRVEKGPVPFSECAYFCHGLLRAARISGSRRPRATRRQTKVAYGAAFIDSDQPQNAS
jgi:hypothetical protein